MPNWKNQTDEQLNTRTLYVGSYGFRDNDAIGSIWAHTARTFIDQMKRTLYETARFYRIGNEPIRDVEELLWFVGPFASNVADELEQMEDLSRKAELRDDIRHNRSGHIY